MAASGEISRVRMEAVSKDGNSVSPKRRYPPRAHGVTTQKTKMVMFAAVRTSNHILYTFPAVHVFTVYSHYTQTLDRVLHVDGVTLSL